MTKTTSTILLVEDDHLVQLHARMALEDAGYDVLAAIDGEDALAKAAARPDIDAIFTDIRLPGRVDGLALATAIRRTHPAAVIIVTSGGESPADAALPAGSTFMGKPYTAAQMCRALEEVAPTCPPRPEPLPVGGQAADRALNTCAGRR